MPELSNKLVRFSPIGSGQLADSDGFGVPDAVKDGLVRPIGTNPNRKISSRRGSQLDSFSLPGDSFPR